MGRLALHAWYNLDMSESDFELRPTAGAHDEYVIEGSAQAKASPYLTLQPLEADELALRYGPGNAPQAAPPRAAQTARAAEKTHAAEAQRSSALRNAQRRTRVDAIRRELAAAVQAWWRAQTLPSDALLRDGLMLLEEGHSLDETQRTLLGRTALARGHGIFTALRHQTDPDRIATLVHEAIMAGTLTPNGLRALLANDALEPHWVTALEIALRGDLASPITALRAQVALNLISSAFWQRVPARVAGPLRSDAPPDAADELAPDASSPARTWVRVGVALLLVAALALLWFLRTRAANFGDVIAVPAGAYMVSGEANARVQTALPAYVIDRTEVTNAAYRACVDAGICMWAAPATGDPLHDGALAQHPVTNVAWEEAQAFCASRAMRLPSVAEWEVAASFAPATQRTWRFPWGDAWEPAFVIGGAENGFTATAAVGSRSPQGDSPQGAIDMAGNAAEWTDTPPAGALDQALVKGGSYQDGATALQVHAMQIMPRSLRAPWIGFRCAALAN